MDARCGESNDAHRTTRGERTSCIGAIHFNRETLELYKGNEDMLHGHNPDSTTFRESEIEITQDIQGTKALVSHLTEKDAEGEIADEVEELDTLSGHDIKEEPVYDGEASTSNDNLDTEVVRFLQGQVKGHVLNDSEQPLFTKAQSNVETPNISSDADSHLQQSSRLVYRCKYCGQQLKKISSLQKHEEGHRNGAIYKCRFCEYYSLERTRIAAHECKHTGEKPFTCNRCDFRCASNCDLSKHSKVHVSDRPFPCKLCSYSAKTANNLQKHLRVHSDNRPFACDLCGQRFKTKCARDNHGMLHSDSVGFFCDKCDYACKTPNLLRQHAISHSEIRNFACSHPGCPQRCKTKSDLTKHMSVHKTGLDFKCVLCKKFFKSIHSLRSHTRRHEKREYPCHVCGKVLSSSNSRRHHMLALHLDGKKIECLICGNKFSSRDNLKSHIKVHESNRSFRCPLCLHGFLDINHLFTHIGAMHGKDYVYVCEICNRPFSRYMMMKFHIDRNHLNEKDKNIVHEFIYDKNCSSNDMDELENKMRVMRGWIKGTENMKAEVNSDVDLEEIKPDLDMSLSIEDRPVGNNIARKVIPSQNFSASPLSCNDLLFKNYSELGTVNPDAAISIPSDILQTCNAGMVQDECSPNCDATSDLRGPTIHNSIVLGNKTLTIKLERLDDNIMSSGKSSVDDVTNRNKSPEKCTKVIKLGSYANVSIKLTGKDSGVKFNLKKGKKCKGWFSHPDNMMPEARKKVLNYYVKQANFDKKNSVRGTPRKKDRPSAKILPVSVSKASSKKSRKHKSKGNSRKKGSVPVKGSVSERRQKSESKLANSHLSENAMLIKGEVQDMAFETNEQSQHQQERFQERDKRLGQSVDLLSCIDTNSDQFHSESNIEIPNIIEFPIGSQVEMEKETDYTFSEILKKKKDPKAELRKKKCADSTKQKKTPVSFCTSGQKYLCEEKALSVLPKLSVVVPKLHCTDIVDGHSTSSRQGLANIVPSAVTEVEDVVGSPLQVTWKKVGGHKKSRSFKSYMQHGQTMHPESSTCSNPSVDIQKCGQAFKHSSTKDFELPASEANVSGGCSSQDVPCLESLLPDVKVMSLEEFEDEYRKKPKVVANVSLNQVRMRPVVQLEDIVRKRKGSMLNRKCAKKKMLMKFRMENMNSSVGNSSVLADVENEAHDVDADESTMMPEFNFSSVEKGESLNNENHKKTSSESEYSNCNLLWKKAGKGSTNSHSILSHKSVTKSKQKCAMKNPRTKPTGRNEKTELSSEDFSSSHQFPNGELITQKKVNENIKLVKARNTKPTLKKKVAVHNKIKVSALFGKFLEKKKSSMADDTQKISCTTQDLGAHFKGTLERLPGALGSPIHKKGDMKMNLKLCSKKSPLWKVKRKENLTVIAKTKTDFKPVKVKTSKGKLDKPSNMFAVSKNKNFSAIENRIKLPGLISSDMTERRLTVECVTLMPKVLLKNSMDCVQSNNRFGAFQNSQKSKQNDIYGQNSACCSSSISNSCGSVANIEDTLLLPCQDSEESLIKIETDGDLANSSRMKEDNMGLSLSLALYKNYGNNICAPDDKGSRQCSNAGSSQCSEDVLKTEEIPSHVIVVSTSCAVDYQNCPKIICDTNVMSEGYNPNVPCAKTDATALTSNDSSISVDSTGNVDSNVSAICDTSVMMDDYSNSVDTNVIPSIEEGTTSTSDTITLNRNGTHHISHHSSLLDSNSNNSKEKISTVELTDNDSGEGNLTAVVELDGDVRQ